MCHLQQTLSSELTANSQATLIMADRRDSMAPETLNMLMILKLNAQCVSLVWWKQYSRDPDSDDFRDPELEADSEEDDDA